MQSSCGHRIRAMYVNKLDGIVDAGFYDKMSVRWRGEPGSCQRGIDRLQSANQS